MSRDDGMDEHGIDWLCGCRMSSGRTLAWKLGKLQLIFVIHYPKIRPSMTHMGQMTTPKPLIIIISTCQEMMAWMSIELIGSVDVMDVIWYDFGSEVGQFIFVKP
jgi:hypothetical protein